MNNSKHRMMGLDAIERSFENPDLLHSKIKEFLVEWPTLIDAPPEEFREPGNIYPSVQGWLSLSNWLTEHEPINDDSPKSQGQLVRIIKELLGDCAAVMFSKFYFCG